MLPEKIYFGELRKKFSFNFAKTIHETVNPFHATDLLIPPENIGKLEVFWYFQGVSKEISGMKWFKEWAIQFKNNTTPP